jgi:hypothetical protein
MTGTSCPGMRTPTSSYRVPGPDRTLIASSWSRYTVAVTPLAVPVTVGIEPVGCCIISWASTRWKLKETRTRMIKLTINTYVKLFLNIINLYE